MDGWIGRLRSWIWRWTWKNGLIVDRWMGGLRCIRNGLQVLFCKADTDMLEWAELFETRYHRLSVCCFVFEMFLFFVVFDLIFRFSFQAEGGGIIGLEVVFFSFCFFVRKFLLLKLGCLVYSKCKYDRSCGGKYVTRALRLGREVTLDERGFEVGVGFGLIFDVWMMHRLLFRRCKTMKQKKTII